MLKLIKIALLYIFIIGLFFCWQNTAYAGVGQEGQDNPEEFNEHFNPETGLKEGKIIIPELQIKIPGVAFGTDKGAWLGNYISGVYNYATAVVGILAAIILMFGGLLWLTAGGESGRITEAKEWMKAALTGLVIALSSYTILYTINPELLEFKSLDIRDVKKLETIPSSDTYSLRNNGVPAINNVFSGSGDPLPDDQNMVNPKLNSIIKLYLTGSARNTVNIEKQMEEALESLIRWIKSNNAGSGIGNMLPISITSLSDGLHDVKNIGDSTHYHGRAVDLGDLTSVNAGVIGEWWISQGTGRRFIWEGDHLHLDIGYPSGN